ncbi:MAG: 50S ribosomal protein L29 [Patescibacteria group bacterium]
MAKKISFKEKDMVELKKLLGEKREELRQARFAATGARVKDVNHAGKVRKDIARILTEMTVKTKTV